MMFPDGLAIDIRQIPPLKEQSALRRVHMIQNLKQHRLGEFQVVFS